MLKRGFKQMMTEANAVIETMAVRDALEAVDEGDVLFVDVRETVERNESGGVAGSVHAPRGFLEFMADPESPMHKPELMSGKLLVLYCASGGRSAFAAKTLIDMGYDPDRVCHMAGGFSAWKEAGGPTEN
jgi:rhodanese-related sulfurtransferase